MNKERWHSLVEEHHLSSCDVCKKNQDIQWMKSRNVNGATEIQFLCGECYNQSAGLSTQGSSEKLEGTEPIILSKRPSWMTEFMKESEEVESLGTIGTDTIRGETSYPEAREQLVIEEKNEILEVGEPESKRQVAQWNATFIQEALFGEDPTGWLKKQGAYEPEKLNETISTLLILLENQE